MQENRMDARTTNTSRIPRHPRIIHRYHLNETWTRANCVTGSDEPRCATRHPSGTDWRPLKMLSETTMSESGSHDILKSAVEVLKDDGQSRRGQQAPDCQGRCASNYYNLMNDNPSGSGDEYFNSISGSASSTSKRERSGSTKRRSLRDRNRHRAFVSVGATG